MDKERIKSAFEIAMERVAGMPTLTAEELARQRELEYAPRGEAIAERYLRNALREADLELELRRYENEERQIVRKALLEALCGAIGLEDADRSIRAIAGIQRLAAAVDLEDAKRESESLFAEFTMETEKRSAALMERERGRLEALGIAGSAVKPNLQAARHLDPELRSGCAMKLEELKQRLQKQAGVLDRVRYPA
ncbi:MAG: hypothetical protein HYX92_14015 [Chloroflexi bacterium]|nr:hypothetical protein [Chloroflexota bacterium]